MPDTPHERKVRRETETLHADLIRLTEAGRIRWDQRRRDWVKRTVSTHRTDRNRRPAYTEDELLARFDKVRQTGKAWLALCPAHEDKHPSLSIRAGDKGWLIKCWAHCDFSDIIVAAGLETQRMFYS